MKELLYTTSHTPGNETSRNKKSHYKMKHLHWLHREWFYKTHYKFVQRILVGFIILDFNSEKAQA